MAIITLTSDFGESDHYVGALKGTILSQIPSQIIVDISHQIQHFDLAHGAFVLRSALPHFPKGSIHLIAVDSVANQENGYLAVQLEDHFFLLPDHGMLGLLSQQEPQMVVSLPIPGEKPGVFPSLEVMVSAAIDLANGKSIEALGTPTTEYHKMLGR